MRFMSLKRCITCLRTFQTKRSQQRYCDKACRVKHYNDGIYERSECGKIATPTVGAISELVIASDLLLKNLAVFRALSPACKVDLIVSDQEGNVMVEVRTAYRRVKDGAVFFPSVHQNADLFAVYLRSSRQCLYISLTAIGSEFIRRNCLPVPDKIGVTPKVKS